MYPFMSKSEKVIRFIVGACMLGLALLLPEQYKLMALIGTYPVLTALMSWDPFEAIFRALTHSLRPHGGSTHLRNRPV